jgi:hypothetical protein
MEALTYQSLLTEQGETLVTNTVLLSVSVDLEGMI